MNEHWLAYSLTLFLMFPVSLEDFYYDMVSICSWKFFRRLRTHTFCNSFETEKKYLNNFCFNYKHIYISIILLGVECYLFTVKFFRYVIATTDDAKFNNCLLLAARSPRDTTWMHFSRLHIEKIFAIIVFVNKVSMTTIMSFDLVFHLII